jgi:NADH-quinone oxidoreductase subunit A
MSYLDDYSGVAAMGAVGLALVTGGLLANRMLRPSVPTPGKLTTYESGVDPEGQGWAQVPLRYFTYAYLYLLFAIEALFLYPWALALRSADLGVTGAVEMGLFVGLLALGLAYAWRTGALRTPGT